MIVAKTRWTGCAEGTSGVQRWDAVGAMSFPVCGLQHGEGALAARVANNLLRLACKTVFIYLFVYFLILEMWAEQTTARDDDTYVCAYVAACQLHTRSISERNAEKKNEGILFLTSGNLLKTHKQTELRKTHSGVHTFCRADTKLGPLMHSFMHLPNILYFMCKHCLSLPPPRISQLRHIHKFMHNNSAGTLFSTARHILSTRLKNGNLISHTRNAALIIKRVCVITQLSEKTQKVDVCCQLEPDVTCLQPICITSF